MVDEGFVTVASIMGSRIYGCSSESGGEVRVTGWWQQVVDATGWVAQFLKERKKERKKEKLCVEV